MCNQLLAKSTVTNKLVSQIRAFTSHCTVRGLFGRAISYGNHCAVRFLFLRGGQDNAMITEVLPKLILPTRLATQVFLPVKLIERNNLAQILPKCFFHEGNLFELVDWTEKTSGNKLLVDINVISVTSQLHQPPTLNRSCQRTLYPPGSVLSTKFFNVRPLQAGGCSRGSWRRFEVGVWCSCDVTEITLMSTRSLFPDVFSVQSTSSNKFPSWKNNLGKIWARLVRCMIFTAKKT